ncbi:MAG TPA: hypothetical protein IGR64_11430, partial [Leptolyngbyaceae cyanobacterium M65_K2018_010]|nr:hypothetical protein [Leptolyngbyaceae cyanobacterium M65_K2018_010]
MSGRFLLLTLTGGSLILTSGCAGSPMGDSLQKSLTADPQLQNQAVFGEDAAEAPVALPDSALRA